MTAGYKKPHVTMNRPRYGNKVKVVRKSTALPKFNKPSVVELKSIYSKFVKNPTWSVFTILAEAIQWYRTVLEYAYCMSYVRTQLGYSKNAANKIIAFNDAIKEAAGPYLKDIERISYLTAALDAGQSVAGAYGIKAPSYKAYLQKGKKASKSIDSKMLVLTKKHDKLLTLFMHAYGDGFTFRISPQQEDLRKFDYSLKILYYSSKAWKRAVVTYRTEGLLSVVVREAWHIARAEAFQGMPEGTFVPDDKKAVVFYKKILEQFAIWCCYSKQAPKSLVRRISKKSKKLTANKEAPKGVSQ